MLSCIITYQLWISESERGRVKEESYDITETREENKHQMKKHITDCDTYA